MMTACCPVPDWSAVVYKSQSDGADPYSRPVYSPQRIEAGVDGCSGGKDIIDYQYVMCGWN